MFDNLKPFLNFSLSPENLPDAKHFEILEKVLEYSYWFGGAPLPSQEEIDTYFRTVKSTHEILLSSEPTLDNPYYSVYQTWTQIYNNTYSFGLDMLVDGPACGYSLSCTSTDFAFNNRHYQMAENVLWQLKSQESLVGIKKRKMIIWTHNNHAARNINSFPDATYQVIMCHLKESPCAIENAGHRVKIALADRSYSLVTMAFTGTKGSNACPPGNDGGSEIYAPVGHLEYYTRVAGFPVAALLDFTVSSLPSWLTTAHFIGYDEYVSTQGDLPSIYDGVLFINEMTNFTCLT